MLLTSLFTLLFTSMFTRCSMRVRKSHFKSRIGCMSCKKKHIKCGEELPSCENCVSRGVMCIYGSGRPMNARSESGDPASKIELPTQPLDTELSPFPDVPNFTRLDEFQLLLHYVNSTAGTISRTSTEDLTVWSRAVPEEATHHDFLMDGLLALSSLHFAFDHPDVRARYVQIGIHYQNSGLRKYTEATHPITKENSHAIFAYSVITFIISLASAPLGQDMFQSSYTDNIASVFELLHGVGAVNEVATEFLQDGYFKVLLQSNPLDENPPGLQVDAEAALSKLRQRVYAIAKYLEPGKVEVYLSSIELLKDAIRFTKTPSNIRNTMAWPGMTDRRLLEYFKRGDPMARLIILHYGVLLIDVQGFWWGRNYGIRLVEELIASICTIDPEWIPWTEWAGDSAAKATGREILTHHSPTPREDEL